jgi:N-acetylglutamate synthase-like GNAT family acetyltransferase
MELRPYKELDREVCLSLLEQPSTAFEAFLNQPGPHFQVLDHNGVIAGCGGFHIEPDGLTAELQWGIIRTDLRRQGVGRYLLMARLREISRQATVQFVVATVPKQFAPFYEGQGFRPQGSSDDGIRLVKKLTVCP